MDLIRPVESVVPGARGRLLEVLARTEQPLSLRALAGLAGVSPAQAARTVPRLVSLGLVERGEAPPAFLLSLNRSNLAARLVLQLADIREALLKELGELSARMRPAPRSIVIFGSLARGEASSDSDIDVLVVRPRTVRAEDPGWLAAIARWSERARAISGNPINVIEAEEGELPRLLRTRRALWRGILEEGMLLAGRPLGRPEGGVRRPRGTSEGSGAPRRLPISGRRKSSSTRRGRASRRAGLTPRRAQQSTRGSTQRM